MIAVGLYFNLINQSGFDYNITIMGQCMSYMFFYNNLYVTTLKAVFCIQIYLQADSYSAPFLFCSSKIILAKSLSTLQMNKVVSFD